NNEVSKALDHAKIMNRKDVQWSIQCARSLGLRIEEVTALTKSDLRNALTNGYVHLTKTKGGIKRDIPLNPGAERTFRDMVKNAQQEKIFIEHGRTHKQAMKSIQTENALKYTANLQEARQQVSTLLGHGRDDVTRIYLAKS